jgi:hypothetical protein
MLNHDLNKKYRGKKNIKARLQTSRQEVILEKIGKPKILIHKIIP